MVYKDEKQWDTWQQSTLAQAKAQDVAKVLDATYVPTSAKDVALFGKKQEFMYAVLERMLQTDQGKAFIHQHEEDFDAQKIYSSLQDYSVKSTKASLDASKLLLYITSAKMGDGAWQCSCLHSKLAVFTKSRYQLGHYFRMISSVPCCRMPFTPLRSYVLSRPKLTNTRHRVARPYL
jgi:hypothetical protein